MAEGKRAQDKSTRERRQSHTDSIKTTKILKKLHDHVLEGGELSSTQLGAAQTLLRKTLPDLKVSEVEVDGSITVEVTRYSADTDT